MSISYPLTMPSTPAPVAVSERKVRTISQSMSPFSGTVQAYDHGGVWWEFDVVLPAMTRAQWAPWLAFFDKLKGVYGTFTMAARPKTPQGSAPGTPLVNGTATLGATTLATKGWTAGQSNILLPGDLLSFGTGSTTELKRIITAADSDGSGNSTVEFTEPIRTVPAANSAIVTSSPQVLCRLSDNVVPSTLDLLGYRQFSFSCREAIS